MEIKINMKNLKPKILIYFNLSINKIQAVDIAIRKQSLNRILFL